jgi:hypothetical protein
VLQIRRHAAEMDLIQHKVVCHGSRSFAQLQGREPADVPRLQAPPEQNNGSQQQDSKRSTDKLKYDHWRWSRLNYQCMPRRPATCARTPRFAVL